MWILQNYPTTVWMKECNIFRKGVKTYSDPSYIFYIFSRGQNPNLQDLRHWEHCLFAGSVELPYVDAKFGLYCGRRVSTEVELLDDFDRSSSSSSSPSLACQTRECPSAFRRHSNGVAAAAAAAAARINCRNVIMLLLQLCRLRSLFCHRFSDVVFQYSGPQVASRFYTEFFLLHFYRVSLCKERPYASAANSVRLSVHPPVFNSLALYRNSCT